ncbi:Cilia- and flagella-associated protein 53 [Cladochytrium tenue]|nr:Cilia- and flagella-associated protein 53 [Cladochytrium tenue]
MPASSGGGGHRSDYLITNRRRDEDLRNRMKEQSGYYAQTLLQSRFEETSTVSIKRNKLFRRVEELRSIEDEKLEHRRESLRELLHADDERLTQELLAREETCDSRLEKMKRRMEELRAKREAERQKVVEEKLMQRWRNECDELRAVESKVFEERVAIERGQQLVELGQRRAQALEERKFFDELWERDRQQKIAREETEKAIEGRRNRATVAVLEAQLETLRKQALEEDRLKKEEAEIMRHESRLRQLEDERHQSRKRAEQQAVRGELDRQASERSRQRAREARAAVELDLRIVDEFCRLEGEAAAGRGRRRAELRAEMMAYRVHLEEQRRVEEERAREVDRLQREESEKLWNARAERWKKEQAARDRLMQEVLEGRRQQLHQALELNQQRQAQMQLEREHVARQLEAARRVESAERARREAATVAHKESLAAQMEVAEERRREERRRQEVEANAQKVCVSE